MNADETSDQAAVTATFAPLFAAADQATRFATLKWLGRHLLRKRPLIEGMMMPDAEDFETSDVPDAWVDTQLYDALPEQAELDNLDDLKTDALEEAWPYGFDEVVFGTGEDDDIHAGALVEAFLAKTNEISLPIMTDFDATDEEMQQHLQEKFVALIHKWRARVIEMLT